MSVETVKVPDIGGAEGVEVIEICVAVGDQVEPEDSLIVLESDKASMEIPCPSAGTVTAIKISNGDSLSEGDIILELETAAAVEQSPAAAKTAEPAPESAQAESSDETAEAPANPDQEVAGTTVETVKVPDIGGSDDVDVIEVCVSVGDELAEGDSLIVLETDKASMEIPAPRAGKVVSLAIKEGDTVAEGSVILELEVAAAPAPAAKPAPAPTPDASTASKAAPAPEITEPAPSQASPDTDAGGHRPVYAGPAVRMLARELGVDIDTVKGTGPRNRITKDDLKDHVKQAMTSKAAPGSGSGVPAVPAVDFAQFGEITLEPMSKIHKVTAENMHRSWLNVPHVTQFDEVDISELEDFRQTLKAEAEQRGVKITPLPFLLKACAAALKAHPRFNASLHSDGEHLVYKHYVNIGMAVDTPVGLMVPVIKNVDKKSIWELAAETVELADKAKNRKLKPAEMQGGCFTLSSLGGIGGQGFTPIVNTPEVAILGISRLGIKPVWNGSEFVPRKMLPLSLSYDHRAINGGDAGRFFTHLGQLLEDIRHLVL